MRRLSATVIVTILIVFCLCFFTACSTNPETEIKYFTIDSDTLKVGIISDSQLVDNGKPDNEYRDNLKRALNALKLRGVNMVLFAGDITDESNNKAYDLYVNAIDDVFGDTPVIFQSIMGNHDYWGNGTKGNCRKVFEKKLGQSPWTHYVVNGYHFIGASPASGSMDKGYKGMEKWLRSHIETAIADNPDNPVFVMTHNSAVDTVYGSEDWGDKTLYDVFKDYPQVVNFSGHLHYSLLDERSIHQQDFTSIATQSVSYTEMEQGKVNGSIPPNASITPMGYIMEITADKIELQRLNFGADKAVEGYEEKSDMRWQIPIPVKKESFTYTTELRKASNSAPVISNTDGNTVVIDGKQYLEFVAGSDDDLVHSYKLVWSNGFEQYYFSDFYNGINNMSKTLQLPIGMKKGTYSVKIYAVDSWNAVSQGYVTINNITVN